MTIEADEQWHQRRVNALETEITTDDIADTTIVGTWHADNVSQNDFRQETTEQTQSKDCQQMNISLPLPHFQSEGLEDGYRQYHKGGTDEAYADSFFMTFVHTAGKGSNKNEEWRMKSEEFASARHFLLISSHFIARLSQTYAEYPRYLAISATICIFASPNDKTK